MSQNQLPNTQTTSSRWSKLLSSGVLIAEAAIATIVLSVFVSSSPKLFTTQPPMPTVTASEKTNSSQNHIALMRLSFGLESKH
ncbi:hypothetical protein OsccyDRAFT_1722 [Leptolyngbyaceae cyanobacterium JSC-12]|nr:hypothetical protein OsccyDRAFT_1722 [Leptolyngbyaceae cyanobacterium JSC-12]